MYRFKNLLKLKSYPLFSTRKFASSNVLQPLSDRCLIRVSGNEASEFLQGLITNDIRHLDGGPASMYSMVLNTKGRVLYDTIIYRTAEDSTYLMECDKDAATKLMKHLKMYRVRRKISIDSLEDSMKVYVVYDPSIGHQINLGVVEKSSKNLGGTVIPCDTLQETQPETKISTKIHRDLIIYRDPRIVSLGSRVIAPKDCDVSTQISEIMKVQSENSEKDNYRKFRYILGVGEGVLDLPPGDCLPLEANCDYLHGVSFHKGCYVGQELTARTYHTGVVRKRLMPLFFTKVPSKLPEDSKILVEKVNLGKFRGLEQDVGLGLLRIAQVLEMENIPIGDGVGHTMKPSWWPIEAPKEKMTAQKS